MTACSVCGARLENAKTGRPRVVCERPACHRSRAVAVNLYREHKHAPTSELLEMHRRALRYGDRSALRAEVFAKLLAERNVTVAAQNARQAADVGPGTKSEAKHYPNSVVVPKTSRRGLLGAIRHYRNGSA